MNWKNPRKELPNDKQVVWVLERHWKRDSALSCEITGYEFDAEMNVFENVDDLGYGHQTLKPSEITAWADETEISLPSRKDEKKR